MKNKSLLALAAVVALLWSGAAANHSAALITSRLSLDDFKFIVGQWEGQLEYLDYRDGKSRVKLATTLDCKLSGEKLEYMFVYTEPNGSKVNGDPSNIKVDAGIVMINGEAWQVTDSSKSEPRRIVLTKEGKDNDKPAMQRRTFSLENGELRILNEVKPEGAQNYFVRNEMKFKRK